MPQRNENGMAMLTVIMMMAVMAVIGTGMYSMVRNVIGVSTAYHKRETTRSVAYAAAGLTMDTISQSITDSTIAPAPGLVSLNATWEDLMGSSGNDNIGDMPDPTVVNLASLGATFAPDFFYGAIGNACTIGNTNPSNCAINAYVDVDFMQMTPLTGGSIEFASAYDGVGQGQTLGSSFLITELVRVVAVDNKGGRTQIRYFADH